MIYGFGDMAALAAAPGIILRTGTKSKMSILQ